MKAITITGRGGLYGCEMLRIPHCLENRMTDGVNFSGLCVGRALISGLFCLSCSFVLETEETPGSTVWLE
jgi:hypothetical protein